MDQQQVEQQVEQVVLLDEGGHAVGAAAKAGVHHAETPLHLAFSCYVFDGHGRFLLTRRAASKKTWPAVWTNSCCGHPGPGEPFADAVRRRVRQELGLDLDSPRLVLPGFRYRAVMPDGVVENEMCPVLVATTEQSPQPDPSEVDDLAWLDWDAFHADVVAGRAEVSPWCVQQVTALGTDPLALPEQPAALLPPAARV